MRIVFGWNHLRIKTFQPHEIGLDPNEKYDFTIEARQKYFHLFWIPFFGIGKSWAIRKNGGKLYEVPAELNITLAVLENDLSAPWYTFLGPLLLVLGGLGFWGYSEIDEYLSHKRSIEHHEQYVQHLTQRLGHLDSTDIITLAGDSGPVQYLKVEKILPKEIKFSVIEQQGDAYKERVLDVEDYYMMVGKRYLPFATIPMDSLLNAIPKTIEGTYMINTSGKDLIGNGKKYIIKEVVRHFRPIIQDERSGSYGGSISMELKSYGWPFEIVSIKNQVGKIEWDPSLIGTMVERTGSHYGNSFWIRGENYATGSPYKFVMTVKDTTGRQFNYQFEGFNLEKTITEL